MKNFICILLLFFIYACNTPVDNEIVEEETIEIKADNKNEVITNNVNPIDGYQGITPNSPINAMLSDISALLIDDDYRSIYQKIDPFQMGIQSEDMEMDSCQNARELFNIKIADFKSNCDVLKEIKNIIFTGYKELEENSYDIIGTVEFNDFSKQAVSFQINVLSENSYVITGPLG